MRPVATFRTRTLEFCRRDDGGITVLSLFLFIVMLIVTGLAVDVNNAQQARVKLQGAADAAGHAALVWRSKNNTEAAAKAKGIELAEANMPTTIFGNVLATADVEFGDWDNVDRTFTPDPGNRTAVRVTTRRVEGRGNSIGTFLMWMIGVDDLTLNTVSVWDVQDGFCPPRSPDKKRGEGFFAVKEVDFQTANTFKDGFCVHSDTFVKLSQANDFEPGTTVSMPDEMDLVLPKSGWGGNPGLPEALTSMDYNLQLFFNQFPTMVNDFFDPASPNQPDYVTDAVVNTVVLPGSGPKLTLSLLKPNAVNVVTCPDDTGFDIPQDALIRDVVIATTCSVKFLKNAAMENATLVTTNTDILSVQGPQGARIGASTYCNDGLAGANVLTLGGVKFASGFQAYGANLIAGGYMELAAQADGLAGINFLSGDAIDVASQSEFGFCGFGPPELLIIPVFRMVM